MADFKKLNPQNHSSSENTQEKTDLILKLLSDPAVVKKISSGDLSREVIFQQPYRIDHWLKEMQPCVGCKDLAFCKQQTKGYFKDLSYDGMLKITQSACKYQLQKIEEEKHLTYYVYDDLPEKMRLVSFPTVYLHNEEVSYQQLFGELLDACSDREGIYLHGNYGSGKTYLAACACNYWARNQVRVAFAYWPDFVLRMASLVKSSEHTLYIERLKHVPFLVIDDIGAESVTEWNRDQVLLPVLNARYEADLPTWFTSNKDYRELEEHFSVTSNGKEERDKAARILERIRVMTKSKTLTGKDRRI